MLHATLLCCAAALAAAKSRGGPSWTAAQREHFATNGYVLQPDVIRPEDRDALVAAFERLFRGDFDTGTIPTSGTGARVFQSRTHSEKS